MGEGGNDTVVGLSSNSYLDGGTGNDLLDLRAEALALVVNLATGAASRGSAVAGFVRVFGALAATNLLTGGAADET